MVDVTTLTSSLLKMLNTTAWAQVQPYMLPLAVGIISIAFLLWVSHTYPHVPSIRLDVPAGAHSLMCTNVR